MGRGSRLALELRRRGIYRTAGLYIGICWILVQAASIVYPAFDAPEWSMRATFLASVAGFPVAIILAWIYSAVAGDISVHLSAEEQRQLRFGGRKMDFVVIGVLGVALVFSLYHNFLGSSRVEQILPPITLIVADVDNETDNPVFEGVFEHMLTIGLEESKHVTIMRRRDALEQAKNLDPNVTRLDVESARVFAYSQNIDRVLAGRIRTTDSGYILDLDVIFPVSGEIVNSYSGTFNTIQGFASELSRAVNLARVSMGDSSLSAKDEPSEWASANNLYVWKAYATGLDLENQGLYEDAVEYYERATEIDSSFVRAYLGWAFSAWRIGDTEVAEKLWANAVPMLETMTERERLRTLGVYYAAVIGNIEKAVATFSELAEKYPGEAAGLNNAAVAAFLTLDFESAHAAGRRLLEIYPESQLYRSNYASYAMYAGNFSSAELMANALIAENPDYGVSYLPLAMSKISVGDYESARDAYGKMSKASLGDYRRSVAEHGLIDLAIHTGMFSEAYVSLPSAIANDLDEENPAAAAEKQIMLSELAAIEGDFEQAVELILTALNLSRTDSTRVASARVFAEAGELALATELGVELAATALSRSEAYGLMVEAIVARADENYELALQKLDTALNLADFWLIRFERARTLIESGDFVKGLEEIGICQGRIGEATSTFLDDIPTIRYASYLPYWKGRAEQELGMHSAAIDSYSDFLALRPEGGMMAEDASRRMDKLQ